MHSDPFGWGLFWFHIYYITVTVNAKSERFLHKWLDLAWGVVKLWLQYDYRQSFSLRKTTICIERHLSETVFDGSYPTIPWLGRQLWHKEFSQVTELKVLKSESSIEMHKPSATYLQSNWNANWNLLQHQQCAIKILQFFNTIEMMMFYNATIPTKTQFQMVFQFVFKQQLQEQLE